MARRIRWQILIATVSSLLVLGLMSYLALTNAAVARPLAGGAHIEGVLAPPPRQLNPLASDPASDPAAADIQALIFEGLMRIGVDGLPEPALAQSWQIDDTGTVYTFTLRADVTWHDGTPLSVDDVLFTLRAIQNPAFAGDPGSAVVWRDVLIDQVGTRSVRCTLRAPFAPFLAAATFPILPAHLLRDVSPPQWASAPFSQRPIGAGPYQLVALDQQHAALVANPRYYAGRPFLDHIELRFFANFEAPRAALARGAISGLAFVSTVEPGQANLPRDIVRHTVPLDSYTILTFNLREGPLADQGLRRALAHGLDKDALIERVLNGQAARLDTPILPGWWAADPGARWYPSDPARAASILDSLGYALQNDGRRSRDGHSLTLTLLTDGAPDRVAAAQEIARQWGALGLAIEVQHLDGPALLQRLSERRFTMALHGWQRLGPDPDIYELWHSSQAARGSNYAGLNDEQIDELLAHARIDQDVVARLASYAAFQERWIELAPSITLYQPLLVYAANAELQGIGFGTAGDTPPGVANSPVLFGREDRFRHALNWFLRSQREIHGDLRQAP